MYFSTLSEPLEKIVRFGQTLDPYASGRFSELAVSRLADNGIVLNYHHEGGVMSRPLAVVKTRASHHDLAMRQFSIGRDGISFARDGIGSGDGER